MSQVDTGIHDTQAGIFAEAEALINGKRREKYGDAENSFERIAALWRAYLGCCYVSSLDVAMLMVLLKMARLMGSKFTHHDSFVDMLGYVGLAHQISGGGVMPAVVHEGFERGPKPQRVGAACLFTQKEVDGLLYGLSHPDQEGVKVSHPSDDVPPDPRKWADETLSSMTYRRACLAFGNGDLGRGKQIIFMLARRLEEAREKHRRFAEGSYQALGIIGGEYGELVHAIEHETHDRAIDEALDVACTCMRFVGREHVVRRNEHD